MAASTAANASAITAPITDPITSPESERQGSLRRGDRVGRYLVLGEIGSGGMGVVYRGYDPQLNRKVALKVLRSIGHPRRAEVARARLQREAQTLARLSHPHVVTVFDVGEHGGHVFVAMALLDGCDLSQWLAEPARPWRVVLPVLVAAGRGLAAAHEVGLVHRDFKPSNVLLAEDGRIAVTDFGLARADTSSITRSQTRTRSRGRTRARTEEIESGAVALAASSSERLDAPLTERGRTVGTPAYMAPEQHAGDAADARADQYAFCVALYEALYGERPFPGRDPAALARAKRELPVLAPRDRTGARIPRRIRAALRRGLSWRAALRYPSLTALLDALSPPSPRGRRRAAAVGVAFGIAATLGWANLASIDSQSRCTSSDERLAGVWDEDVRARVDASLRDSGLPYADHVATRVTELLDERATQWADEHAEACRASWDRGEQSAQVLDRRMRCLGDQRRAIAATTRVLATANGPDRIAVEHAVDAVLALPPARRCADEAHLRSLPSRPADPMIALDVERIDEALFEVRALRSAGRHREALTRVEALVVPAHVTEHAPTEAAVMLALSQLASDVGDPSQAAEAAQQAAVHARTAEQTSMEAVAWIELLRHAAQGHDAEQGRFYADLAGAAITSTPGTDSLRARILSELGELELRVGDHEAAHTHLLAALTLQEEILGPEHLDVAQTLVRLAGVRFRRGDLDGARGSVLRGLDIYTTQLGEQHPRRATPLGNLGLILSAAGDHEAALEPLEAARTLLVGALGAQHPAIANADDTIAEVLARLGRLDEASASFERAVAVFEGTLGREHPAVAAPLLGLGEVALQQDRPDAARTALQRAHAIARVSPLPRGQVLRIEAALEAASVPVSRTDH